MSAYIVDLATIHAIVHAAVTDRAHGSPFSYYWQGRRYEVTDETADAAGEVLIRENVRSVRARYPDSEAEDLPGRIDCEWAAPYVYPQGLITRAALAPVIVFKLLSCLEYQSCETEDWDQSQAFALCDALRRSLIHRLPGYEDAPWGLDEYPVRPKVATAR